MAGRVPPNGLVWCFFCGLRWSYTPYKMGYVASIVGLFVGETVLVNGLILAGNEGHMKYRTTVFLLGSQECSCVWITEFVYR